MYLATYSLLLGRGLMYTITTGQCVNVFLSFPSEYNTHRMPIRCSTTYVRQKIRKA